MAHVSAAPFRTLHALRIKRFAQADTLAGMTDLPLELEAPLAPHGPRLERSCRRVVAGETKMFTGVTCGSYHDVWMESHEDLILTHLVDRAEEGSF